MKQIKIQFGILAFSGIVTMMCGGLTSCSKSSSTSNTPPPPPVITIDGYDSSGAVAQSNLVAYFPLNGNGNDVIGNETGTVNGTGVQWVTGVITGHKAYQGDTTGTYISCPASARFANLNSFALSAWIKTPPTGKKPGGGTPGTSAEGIFFLGSASASGQGEMILESDNNSASQQTADSVVIHAGLFAPSSAPNQFFVPNEFAIDTAAGGSGGSGGWMHVVMTYDSSTSNFVDYINGVPNQASIYGTYALSNQLDQAGSGTTPVGNLNLSAATPATVTIGAWPALGLFGLNNSHSFAGTIAEVRVYNRALSATEVQALYANGKAGQ